LIEVWVCSWFDKQDKVTSDFHYLQLAIKYVQGQMDHLNKSEKVLLQDTQDNKTKEEEENIESQKTNNGVF
jgi:hemerythrin-like domain-containing protein